MKKYLFVFLILNYFVVATAQCDKTLEVVVSDTLELEGDRFVYAVILTPDGMDRENFLQKDKKEKVEGRLGIKELEKIMAAKGLKRIEDNNEYQIGYAEEFISEFMINIEFDSKAALSDFIERIKDYKNVTGVLTQKIVDERPENEEKLMRKVLKKADEKARKMAAIIENEIAEIVEVSEYVERSENYNIGSFDLNASVGWTAYPPLSQMNNQTSASVKVVIEKTIRVKYRMK